MKNIDLEEDEKSVRETVSEVNPLQFLLYILPRFASVIYFIILFLWIYRAEGGFGFTEASVFGWHALLMSIFVVFFTQEAILSYYASLLSCPCFEKKTSRTTNQYSHIGYHTIGIVFAMIGITAIVYYKNLSPQPVTFPFFATFSPHSWVGIAVLILWALQVVVGIYVFVKRDLSPKSRIQLSKLHKFLGKAIYIAGLATCALGLQDMQSSDLAASTTPIPGVSDTQSMYQIESITIGNSTFNISGYFPYSPEAQFSCAASILLLVIGMVTFAVLEYFPPS